MKASSPAVIRRPFYHDHRERDADLHTKPDDKPTNPVFSGGHVEVLDRLTLCWQGFPAQRVACLGDKLQYFHGNEPLGACC